MKAVIWDYKYSDMMVTWVRQMTWLVNAMKFHGIDVKLHRGMKCTGLENLPKYEPSKDKGVDICVYNHADISHLTGNILPVQKNWFFKPTVPDNSHTTLDALGYGPFSSITYERPDFENSSQEDVDKFFSTTVKGWLDRKDTKFGRRFENREESVPYDDYYLVCGQCYGDETVVRHDFGSHALKLGQVIKELTRVDEKRMVIVKLHPYMNGEFQKDTRLSDEAKKKFEEISPRVKVYTSKSNIHSFIKKARCVLLANSGSGFEAMMHHKPIITWGHPEYHWVTHDLRHLANLIRAIKLDWFDAKKQDKFLYWYMEKYCYYNQETANRRVGELLHG
jgi:hypothetical protein